MRRVSHKSQNKRSNPLSLPKYFFISSCDTYHNIPAYNTHKHSPSPPPRPSLLVNADMNFTPHIKRKQVSFNESVKCHCVVRFASAETWYAEKDFSEFKKEIQDIRRCIVQEKMPPTMFCTRGMEYLIDEQIKRKKRERRILAWDTVFIVQVKQWCAEDRKEQSHDDTAAAIGLAYANKSQISRRDAYTLGLQDQNEARFLQHQDRFPCKEYTDQSFPLSSLDLNTMAETRRFSKLSCQIGVPTTVTFNLL
jgi:hypothetical protein